MARVTNTKVITAQTPFTVGELLEFLDGLPDDATASITTSRGDRPFDSGTTSISITYNEESGR